MQHWCQVIDRSNNSLVRRTNEKISHNHIGEPLLLPDLTPEQRVFFQALNVAYIATEENNSNPLKVRIWGSVIAGDSIFSFLSAKVMKIKLCAFLAGDPANLKPGCNVGILGLDASAQCVLRINAGVTTQTSVDLLLSVKQTFSVYPESFRNKQLEMSPVPFFLNSLSRSRINKNQGVLDSKSIDLIEQSTSFFLATSSGCKEYTVPDTAIGCDMALREGLPSFVTVEARHTSRSFHVIKWTETPGNNLFASLGNLALNPRAGLLFIDWRTGDMLQITGSVEILHNQSNISGTQRVVELIVYMYQYSTPIIPTL